MVVYLRRALWLLLDDLLAITREFICREVSRSGLGRRLHRHRVRSLRTLRDTTAFRSAFGGATIR